MGILEEKKAKLGIKSIDPGEQNKLFNDFVDVGGKVVELHADPKKKINSKLESWIERKEEEERMAAAAEQRKKQQAVERQKAIQQNEILKKAMKSSSDSEKAPQQKSQPFFQIPDVKPHPAHDYFSKLAAKIVCIIYGIFNITGSKFKHAFINFITIDLQNSFLDARQILVSLLHQDKVFSSQIRKSLESTGYPHYYELIYRFDTLFSEELFTQIKDLSVLDNPIRKGRILFVKLFKNLLLLNRYSTFLSNGFRNALSFEKKIRGISQDAMEFNLRKINRSVNMLFNNFFPKILNLCDYYYKEEIAQGKKMQFKDFLGLANEDTIGFYTSKWIDEDRVMQQKKEQEEKLKKLEEEKERAEVEKESSYEGITGNTDENDDLFEMTKDLPEQIRFGLRLIRNSINFNELLDYFKSVRDFRSELTISDKVFLTQLILEYFDKSFSFLFLTSGIQYNVYTDRGMRKDMKNILKDLYFHLDEIYKKEMEYIKIIIELKKVKSSTYMQPKEQFASVQRLSIQRSQISRSMRAQASTLANDFSLRFRVLLENYENEKNILQNPEDILPMDFKFADKKIIRKKKIIEYFAEAYNFSSAIYYLASEGELGGSGVALLQPILLKYYTPATDIEFEK